MKIKTIVFITSLVASLGFVLSACEKGEEQEQVILERAVSMEKESTQVDSIQYQIMVQRATQTAI